MQGRWTEQQVAQHLPALISCSASLARKIWFGRSAGMSGRCLNVSAAVSYTYTLKSSTKTLSCIGSTQFAACKLGQCLLMLQYSTIHALLYFSHASVHQDDSKLKSFKSNLSVPVSQAHSKFVWGTQRLLPACTSCLPSAITSIGCRVC